MTKIKLCLFFPFFLCILVLNFSNPSPCRAGDDEVTPVQGQEVSFSSSCARKGWKVIADDGHSIDGSALGTVVSMIKDMECQVAKTLNHRTVPPTLKLPYSLWESSF